MRATVVIGAYCLLLVLLGLTIEKVDPFWTDRREVASLSLDVLLGWAAVYSLMHLTFGFLADRWWVLALPLLPVLLLWIYYLAFIPLGVLATAAGVALRRLARSLRRRKRQWVQSRYLGNRGLLHSGQAASACRAPPTSLAFSTSRAPRPRPAAGRSSRWASCARQASSERLATLPRARTLEEEVGGVGPASSRTCPEHAPALQLDHQPKPGLPGLRRDVERGDV